MLWKVWLSVRWCVGVVAAVVFLAAQVSYDNASSNLASWFGAVGTTAPAFLTSQSADAWAKGIAVAVLLAMAGAVFVRRWRRRASQAASGSENDYVPLNDAGQWLYEHASERIRDALRGGVPTPFETIAEHAAAFFRTQWAEGRCKIYGRWEPGLPMEEISAKDGEFSAFEAVFGSDRRKPVDLSVKRADLQRVLSYYERDETREPRIEIQSVEPDGSAFTIINPGAGLIADGLVKIIAIDGADHRERLPMALRTQRQREEDRGSSFNLRGGEQKKVPFCVPAVARETKIAALAGPVSGETLTFHIGCYGGSEPTHSKIAVIRNPGNGLEARLLPGHGGAESLRNEVRRAERRLLISKCRDLAHAYMKSDPEESFREHLESSREYADIRGHLGKGYLSKLNAQRVVFVPQEGARYPVLVSGFLDELDRLEREWEIV